MHRAVLLLALAAAAPPPPLLGTTWRLEAYAPAAPAREVRPGDDARYELRFEPGGRLSAHVNCNAGAGRWASAGAGRIVIGALATTQRGCLPDALEFVFGSGLARVDRYAVADGALLLELDGGGVLRFRPAPPKATLRGRPPRR